MMSEADSRTLLDILSRGSDYLAEKGVDQPRLACELLASRLLKCKRLELYLKYERVLSQAHIDAMRRGLKRVAEGEPVQYVLGETDFLGHTFKVDRRALIPRPETETLVNAVLDCAALWDRARRTESLQRPVMVDVGTGSGCIILSLALARREATYIGIDIRAESIELASENAEALGVADRVVFSCGEIADTVEPQSLDAIVSNPPYVPTQEYERLPAHIRAYEPRIALDGGTDGLDSVRALAQDASMALLPGGFFFMEIAEDKAPAVRELLQECGFEEISVIKDLAERDRVVSAVLKE